MRTIVAALVAAVIVVGVLAVSNVPARASGFEIPDPCDFITGGGFIMTPMLSKANFGAHGGCKHGSFWGHVNYVDHEGTVSNPHPYHISSTEITAYFMDLPNARNICGKARTNRGETDVKFRVRMEENDPAAPDVFEIVLENGYFHPPTPLGGGNIKLHKANHSHQPPPPPHNLDELCPPLPDDPGGGTMCPLPTVSDGQGGCMCPPGSPNSDPNAEPPCGIFQE